MSLIEDARETHIAVTFVGDDYETCLVCSQPAPCLAIRLADELADMERSRATVVAKSADRIASLKSDNEVLARQRETLWDALEQVLHVGLNDGMEWETVEQIVKDGPGKFDVLALLEHLGPSSRQVETAEELDALPEDTIVADSDGNAWQMGECIDGVPTWREAGSGDHWTSGNVSLPATVLWTPEGEQ